MASRRGLSPSTREAAQSLASPSAPATGTLWDADGACTIVEAPWELKHLDYLRRVHHLVSIGLRAAVDRLVATKAIVAAGLTGGPDGAAAGGGRGGPTTPWRATMGLLIRVVGDNPDVLDKVRRALFCVRVCLPCSSRRFARFPSRASCEAHRFVPSN